MTKLSGQSCTNVVCNNGVFSLVGSICHGLCGMERPTRDRRSTESAEHFDLIQFKEGKKFEHLRDHPRPNQVASVHGYLCTFLNNTIMFPHCSTKDTQVYVACYQCIFAWNRKCQDYIYVNWEYYSTMQIIKHYFKHENKVNENKVLTFCEASRYM